MFHIRDVVVTPEQEEHIWTNHHVNLEEVEGVCFSQPLVLRGRDGSYAVLGQTGRGTLSGCLPLSAGSRRLQAGDGERHGRKGKGSAPAASHEVKKRMARIQDPKPRKVPKFKTEAEAAEFWDTHSPLDYPEEFNEVEATFPHPLIKRGLTVKLDEETIRQLREIAEEKGIGPSTLVRMWILEHLKERKKAS